MSTPADAIEISDYDGGVELVVKVVPGSSRNKIAGVWGTALRVAVAAPPEAGKANQQVVRLLANLFGVKRADVVIAHGQTQPVKRMRVSGVSPARARQAMAEALGTRA